MCTESQREYEVMGDVGGDDERGGDEKYVERLWRLSDHTDGGDESPSEVAMDVLRGREIFQADDMTV